MRLLLILRWILLCGIVLSSSVAVAGGFLLPFRGARALSHGGAFVVSADNLNAQWYNPALLFRSKSVITAYLDVGLLHLDSSFQRRNNPLVMQNDPNYANGYPSVSKGKGWFMSPSLAVASNFTLRDFMFAFGVYGPYAAGKANWPEDGPQRYSLTKSDLLSVTFQLSAAWHPIKQLAVGVGLTMTNIRLLQYMKVSTYPGVIGFAEDTEFDALIRLEAADNFNMGAVIGIWATPIKGLELGITYQTPVTVNTTGKLKLQMPSSYYFEDSNIEGEKVNVKSKFPMMIRAGIRYVMADVFDIEFNFMWEQWSVHKSVIVSPDPAGSVKFKNVPGLGDYVVKPFTVDESFKDSFSFHLGASYKILKKYLEVRAGYFFETATVPDRTLSVNTPDGNKHGLTLGLSATYWKFRFDLTYAHIWIATRTVTTSGKRQVNPLYTEDTFASYQDKDGLPTIIGNGKYTARYNILAMALSFVY